MKKQVLLFSLSFLILLICISTLSVVAQNLSISYQGLPLQPNEEIILNGIPNGAITFNQVTISNNGTIALDVLVKKVEYYIVGGQKILLDGQDWHSHLLFIYHL